MLQGSFQVDLQHAGAVTITMTGFLPTVVFLSALGVKPWPLHFMTSTPPLNHTPNPLPILNEKNEA